MRKCDETIGEQVSPDKEAILARLRRYGMTYDFGKGKFHPDEESGSEGLEKKDLHISEKPYTFASVNARHVDEENT